MILLADGRYALKLYDLIYFVPAKQTPSRLEKKKEKGVLRTIVFLFFRPEIVQKEGDNTFRLECDIE